MDSDILEIRSNRFALETLFILISTLLAQLPSASAQCEGLPGPPQNPIIVEGALPSIQDPVSGNAFNPSDASVGMDGCGRFMITWTVVNFPSGDPLNPNDDTVLIQRFLPDGTPDTMSARVSE